MNPEPENVLPFELGDDEKLLWSLSKPPAPARVKLRRLLWAAVGVLVLLALGCMVSDQIGLGMLLLCVALLCLTGAGEAGAAPHGISYALSNRRAFIIEQPTRRGRPCTVITFRVRRDLVCRVLRRSNGHVDYYLGRQVCEAEEDRPRGFINLAPEQDPAPLLEQLGVEIPAEGKTRKGPGFSYPAEEPRRRPGKLLFMAVVAGLGCLLCLVTHGTHLLLTGQETTAGIVSYEQVSDHRGRKWTRRTVTVHHPVLSFTTPGGMEHKVKSLYGFDNEPKYPVGTQVEVLYDPDNPGCATIRDYGIFYLPGFMLLGFLFFLSQYLRRSKDKQPDYVLIKCVP